MCYRCSVCNVNVGPKVILNRYIVYRTVSNPPRQEIKQELPVCNLCKQLLDGGLTIQQAKNTRYPKVAPINLAPTSAPALQAESVF